MRRNRSRPPARWWPATRRWCGGTVAQNPCTTASMSYQPTMSQLPPATGVLLLMPVVTDPRLGERPTRYPHLTVASITASQRPRVPGPSPGSTRGRHYNVGCLVHGTRQRRNFPLSCRSAPCSLTDPSRPPWPHRHAGLQQRVRDLRDPPHPARCPWLRPGPGARCTKGRRRNRMLARCSLSGQRTPSGGPKRQSRIFAEAPNARSGQRYPGGGRLGALHKGRPDTAWQMPGWWCAHQFARCCWTSTAR